MPEDRRDPASLLSEGPVSLPAEEAAVFAMQPLHDARIYLTSAPPGSLAFTLDGREYLRFDSDGAIFVYGEPARPADPAVGEAAAAFIKRAGLYLGKGGPS